MKISAQLVIKQITDDHKSQRLSVCRDLLMRSKCSRVAGYLPEYDNVKKGEKVMRLVYTTAPQKKRFEDIIHPSSPMAKKFKEKNGNNCLRCIWCFFFNIRTRMDHKCQIAYCIIRDKVGVTVRRNRPSRSTKKVISQHRMPPYGAKARREWIEKSFHHTVRTFTISLSVI